MYWNSIESRRASAQFARTNIQPVSASNIPSKDGGDIPRPLTKDEILRIVKKYGEAAKRAQIAGFDTVEIHAGHSYLLSQFLSPLTNKRTDEFGGSPENRARFTRLVMEEVRKQVGPHFPIFLRFSADEFLEGGNTLDDCLEYLQYIQEEADVLDVSCGLNGSIQYQIDANHLPDGWRSYMARAVKERFNKPCVTMGNIRDPKVANDILERGDADLIGMGRGLIADLEWVNKVEFGNPESIRKCISCNIGCAGNRIGINRPIRCTINPAVPDGEVYKKSQITKPCNVVVVGGGTAGMEAACTAAEVGCTTFLIEKKDHLGGLAADISKIPDKKRLSDFPNYMIHRTKSLNNLFTFTGMEANIDFIKSLKPNIVVNATGSSPLLPPIPGLLEHIDQKDGKVSSILHMIENLDTYPEDLTGKKVVVIGGGAVGLDVVEYFAPRGADVSIVEMMPVIGNGIDPVSKVDINTLMKKYNVNQMPNTALKEVRSNSFLVETNNETKELSFDYGFICLGMKAEHPVLHTLREAFEDDDSIEILNIGDSVRARRIIEGTEEGRNILSTLEKRGYL